MTDLSIVIVSYRDPALLRTFLKSLSRHIPKSIVTEVIVVDSASEPETRNVITHDAVQLFQNIRLISANENTGYTRGVNLGIADSAGTYVLNLNPDTLLTSGCIEEMLSYMNAHTDVGLLGPKLLNMDGSRQDSCYRFYTPYTMAARRMGWLPGASAVVSRFLMRDSALEKPTDVDWLMGSAFIARRKAIDEVGALDERFFHYCSDDDLARRFWHAGWRVVYYPSALVYHWHARHSKGKFGILELFFRPQARWHVGDALRYFRKHGLSVQRPHTS
jgi:N-acetylglucosaminyl-diphospho-decaprenol L-rhamnosyltransferase